MIIAIDGAGSDLSLALAEPDGSLIAEDAWSSTQRQSAELLPRLQALLSRAERALDTTTALAVGAGPGSFTGLRVSTALAKGLAFALGHPIVGVPSLTAWLEADPEASAALSRAGARDAYLLPRGEARPVIVDRDELPAALGEARVVAPTELAEAFDLRARSPRGAPAIARLAAARLAAEPAGDDLRSLEPIYLRAPRGVTVEQEGRIAWL